MTVKILSRFQHFFTVFLNEIPAALASLRDLFKTFYWQKTVTLTLDYSCYCTLALFWLYWPV